MTGLAEALLGSRTERQGEPPIGDPIEWRWDGQQLMVMGDRYGAHPLLCAARDAEPR